MVQCALPILFLVEPLVPLEEVEEPGAGEAEDAGVAVDRDALVLRAGLLRVLERGRDAGGAGGGVGVPARGRALGRWPDRTPRRRIEAVTKPDGEAEALAGSAAARRSRFAWNVPLAV
jgi:hypothetical protein